MKHRIRIAAFIVEGDKVLLVKHVHPETKKEWWVPPGGKMEPEDKSLFDCAVRETWEETNLKVKPGNIAYIREFMDEEHNKLNLEIFVLIDSHQDQISMKNLESNMDDYQYVKDVRWMAREELEDVVIYPEIMRQDEFWQDAQTGFPAIKYLGRQD